MSPVVGVAATALSTGRPSAAFWRGKRVLLTGHTGFKGGWLALWLQQWGAEVTGVALAPSTQPSLFDAARLQPGLHASHLIDIRDAAALAAVVHQARPEIVLHLAAQPLVRASYTAPLDTFSSNVMGTAHVLDALRGQGSVRSVVVVTTDKVYANREWAYPYREGDALGGHDPYSASKAASEIVVACYRDAFLQRQGVAVSSARAGNVIGGGDWSADRLIPDAVRAWQTPGEPLLIRRPQSIRPWQHVLEPVAAYLCLAERQWQAPALAGSYNFGPLTHEAATVGDVIALARQAYGRGEWVCAGQVDGPHEAGWLALEVAQARVRLGVQPRWGLKDAVERTMHWYRQQAEGADAQALCLADWAAFEAVPPLAAA
ncbi:MAG: CDP-glucose 4,6-dehydratase [Pseudomonadota bacterium]